MVGTRGRVNAQAHTRDSTPRVSGCSSVARTLNSPYAQYEWKSLKSRWWLSFLRSCKSITSLSNWSNPFTRLSSQTWSSNMKNWEDYIGWVSLLLGSSGWAHVPDRVSENAPSGEIGTRAHLAPCLVYGTMLRWHCRSWTSQGQDDLEHFEESS